MEAALINQEANVSPGRLPAYCAAMEGLADRSFKAYRALVYETPGFLEYFRAATPITEIAQVRKTGSMGCFECVALRSREVARAGGEEERQRRRKGEGSYITQGKCAGVKSARTVNCS